MEIALFCTSMLRSTSSERLPRAVCGASLLCGPCWGSLPSSGTSPSPLAAYRTPPEAGKNARVCVVSGINPHGPVFFPPELPVETKEGPPFYTCAL